MAGKIDVAPLDEFPPGSTKIVTLESPVQFVPSSLTSEPAV